jgi:hypothetical protein
MATILDSHFIACELSPQIAITLRAQTFLYILVISWEFKLVAVGGSLQPKFSYNLIGHFDAEVPAELSSFMANIQTLCLGWCQVCLQSLAHYYVTILVNWPCHESTTTSFLSEFDVLACVLGCNWETIRVPETS